MEPPKGFWVTLWSFIRFLPYFIALLILGIIKGVIFCPLICLIIAIGNSMIIVGLWLAHGLWTYYCILRAKLIGPVLKLVLCICVTVLLVCWPLVGIVGSILGGAGYGLLAPVIATFKAVEEGKTDKIFHCLYDGTVDTLEGSFTIVRDVMDVCFHSYFSIMDDLRLEVPPTGKPYEIRVFLLLGAVLVAVLGIIVDFVMITCVSIVKAPIMLFKGWQRLFHDLIGREGPFLETICVPFAGFAILFWPVLVVGALLGAMVSSIFLGAYAGVVLYQESSVWSGLCYIIASLAMFDEYCNDMLGMAEGTCFPSPQFRKKSPPTCTNSQTSSVHNPPSRTVSLKIVELNLFELLDSLFKDCKGQGERLIAEGLITPEDIDESKSRKYGVICLGLPAYCILQALLRSIEANCEGILLRDTNTEINSRNRPKDAFYEWFLNPLLVIKDQIKAHNLTEEEEKYLSNLVLLSGHPERLKNSIVRPPAEENRKKAELDGLARRLQGITKSISRYPTAKRRFDVLTKSLSEELARKNFTPSTNGGRTPRSHSLPSRSQSISRSKSSFIRIFSQKSFRNRTENSDLDREETRPVVKDIEIA
ncbi:uncharacterized membrane protein At3g27390-like isoform X1 [Papaver somniferum]|uniref:uncharacterized membrane protein At3g27390-like isoform X1 n=1 Tax=Papaver somniferum TaxID=3469 RepID=UPI000E6F51D3|nr:uncharacterized membrane protein At3g27390-like isoform X1 [Papaver somniferum]